MDRLNDYKVIRDVGKGSFGIVKLVERIADGKQCVWKQLKYGEMSEKEKKQLVREVNILRELHDENIVEYVDRIIDKNAQIIYIVMEHCEGGDMAHLIKHCKNTGEPFPEDLIWKIMSQIASALHACHFKDNGSVFHRDLKPGNVFLDKN